MKGKNNLNLGTDKNYRRTSFQKSGKGEELLNLPTPPHEVWVHSNATVILVTATFEYLVSHLTQTTKSSFSEHLLAAYPVLLSYSMIYR